MFIFVYVFAVVFTDVASGFLAEQEPGSYSAPPSHAMPDGSDDFVTIQFGPLLRAQARSISFGHQRLPSAVRLGIAGEFCAGDSFEGERRVPMCD